MIMRFMGSRLKRVREDKKISRDHLSMDLAVIGCRITGRTLANWENEKTIPDATSLMYLASYFKKDVRGFFDPELK
jgi:transcriptional regulator with XRE-family HTH domain